MNPTKIDGETRCIGKPANWDEATMGSCGALSVRDSHECGCNVMQSVWRPTQFELELLQQGHGVLLTIFGTVHPVVSMSVERPADRPQQVTVALG